MSTEEEWAVSVRPPIRTRAKSACIVCGGTGEIAYSGMHDRLFGVAGEWTLRRCRNRDCGLLWLDPTPIEEDLPRLYDNYYTHLRPAAPSEVASLRDLVKHRYLIASYGERRVADHWAKVISGFVRLVPGLRSEFDLAAFELPTPRGGRLLEIGCGNGSKMRRMAELGWEVQGVDFDKEAVKLAQSWGLDVRPGTLEAQDYPSACFDAVVMSHVIEHVPDPHALLGECRRILKPGGRLVSITPNASSWGHSVFGSDWLGLDPPRHLQVFTPASLRRLAADADWQIVVTSSNANAYGTARASRRLKRDNRFDMTSNLDAVSGYIIFPLYQVFAALRLQVFPETGEELVLHATKRA